MSNLKYQWIVLSSSIASALCLLLAFTHANKLVMARGMDIGWVWQLWALAPGAFCIVVWLFQTRRWARTAGIVSTLGVLVYSAWILLRTLSFGVGGDMAGLVTLDGIIALAVTIGWSGLVWLVGWVWSSS